MAELVLKKADKRSIPGLHSILVECGNAMWNQYQLSHWYPFMELDTFSNLMREKIIYGVYENETAVATFNTSPQARDYYYPDLWSDAGEKALYVGQLGILPSHQSKGIGKWCMTKIEDIARQQDFKVIRFDALNKHPWLKSFYEKLGYRFCGLVTSAQWELACFEKQLMYS